MTDDPIPAKKPRSIPKPAAGVLPETSLAREAEKAITAVRPALDTATRAQGLLNAARPTLDNVARAQEIGSIAQSALDRATQAQIPSAISKATLDASTSAQIPSGVAAALRMAADLQAGPMASFSRVIDENKESQRRAERDLATLKAMVIPRGPTDRALARDAAVYEATLATSKATVETYRAIGQLIAIQEKSSLDAAESTRTLIAQTDRLVRRTNWLVVMTAIVIACTIVVVLLTIQGNNTAVTIVQETPGAITASPSP